MPEAILHTDAELLLRIAEGDEPAFEKLALRYTEKVFAHALTFVKSYPLAQEMVQDIFLRVWNNREKLASVENFNNYLFVLSRNLLVSALRRKVNTPEFLAGHDGEEVFYRPDAEYDRKELKTLLEKGIAQLPGQKQEIFRLIHQEGLSQEEVARKLGIATRTVRWNLVSALNFLRDFLFRHTGGKVAVFLFLLPSAKYL